MVWDTYIVINQKLQIRIGLFTANCKQGPEKVHLSALLADEERSKAIWVCLIMPYIDGALFMKGLHIRASLQLMQVASLDFQFWQLSSIQGVCSWTRMHGDI